MKQAAPPPRRTLQRGALVAPLLLTLAATALPAHAAKKKTAARPAAAAPAAPSSVQGDYIVAIVNREPVTNHEVQAHAQKLSQQLAAARQPVPARAELLRLALDEVVLRKAAIQSARTSGVTLTDEEFNQIEVNRAREAKMSVAEFRRKTMAAGRLTEAQYFSTLRDEILLERVRDGRISAEVARISDQEALQLLREERERQGGAPLVMPEFHASHILLVPAANLSEQQALARLASVRRDIASGKIDFASAARQLSQDGSASNGGDLGWFQPGMMVPEFQSEIDKLKPGQLSQPFLSRYGAHLVQLVEVREKPMNAQQQLALARATLRQQRSALALQQWENELRSRTYIEMREAPR